MKIVLKILIGIVALFLLVIFYIDLTSGQTTPIKDEEGNIIPGSIFVLEKIELGGMEQWVSIRGEDKANPVLIWLHGGPGSTQMPLAHHLDQELEEEFVVVNWDQRGAGKSNPRNFDEDTMSIEQFKSDGVELIKYVLERLDKEKVYLLGHSWGTCLGIELADEHPEYIHTYIGVSQVVNDRRAVQIAYDWVMEKAIEEDHRDRIEFLQEELGEPPYSHSEYRQLAQLVGEYGGNFDLEIWKIALIALRAPEYRVIDYFRLLSGMNRGGGPLHDDEMLHFNYIEEIPAVELPVFFLVGEKDYNTPTELVEEYYQTINAPQKELIILKNSAHTPFLKEPENFYRDIIEIKEKYIN